MSVIKSFAHSAHQSLSPLAPHVFKRSHVYELIAAGLGFKSWASLSAAHVLIDKKEIKLRPNFSLNVLARALQLGLSQPQAEAVAQTFHAQCTQHPFDCLALAELDESLFGSLFRRDGHSEQDEEGFQEEEEHWFGELEKKPARQVIPRSSQMLLDDLAARASHGDAFSHYRLAKLLTCKVPSDYLYQESLKGRVLVTQEQIWVDKYLLLVTQREKYLQHLKAAAEAGIRAANLEYAIEANEPSYRERAVNMKGEIDRRLLAETALSNDERKHWLKQAADDGDVSALEELADWGDASAAEQLALSGNPQWLREVAESALQQGDVVAAWKWHFVALHHELDLTKSTMHAYHDGGSNDGEFYDSDFGGPLYVGGDEGLVLPEVSANQLTTAKKMAEQLLSDASKRSKAETGLSGH
jgi:hypothetical protein